MTDQSATAGIVKALELAEDVLSQAPMSTMIWPNGVHPQTGITTIRNALASARASLRSDVAGDVQAARDDK